MKRSETDCLHCFTVHCRLSAKDRRQNVRHRQRDEDHEPRHAQDHQQVADREVRRHCIAAVGRQQGLLLRLLLNNLRRFVGVALVHNTILRITIRIALTRHSRTRKLNLLPRRTRPKLHCLFELTEIGH